VNPKLYIHEVSKRPNLVAMLMHAKSLPE